MKEQTHRNLRTSHYTLVIDTKDGDALVMNQPRGAVDVMPLEYAQLIEECSPEMTTELREYCTSVGYLTDLSELQEEAWFCEKVRELEHERESVFQAPLFSFVTTYSCNLACSYCFQANTEIRSAPSRFMTMDVAEQCISVVRAAPRHPERAVVELFGGEPLLPNLLDVVRLIVLECEELGYITRATTNATHLHRFEDLLGPTRLAELQVSIDGLPEHHDKRRIPVNGAPTFDRIWENVRLALDRGVRVMIRTNLDRRNISGFAEFADFLDNEGFLDHPNGELHYIDVQPDPIAPDYGLDTTMPLAEIERFLRESSKEFPVLEKIAAPHEIGSFETWISKNFHHPNTRHCGAVTNNVYFAPDLRVYSCHETAGREELSIGQVVDGTLNENSSAGNWRVRRVDNLPGCRRCPYALTCSGGCAARTPIASIPTQSYCNGFDAKFRELITRQYHASLSRSPD